MERPLALGTAGHIDHGKTALIKALTGRDTDRLKEEKERGISIELGYAELALPSGRKLSVVDVPGHERFVKTMVAGASGIDMFLLVVAADDGVMPQTREHLRIIELLGVPSGLVALTKIDAVDGEMAALARVTVEELLGSSPYGGAPIIPVSGVTGEGLPDLLAALDGLVAAARPRPGYPATRMPVDRVFTLKGIGTVVTGTLWSGSLSTEDRVAIVPARGGRIVGSQSEVRVRSIQVHDADVREAAGGQRVALNLTGVERDDVERGQWVVKDPAIEPTYLADAKLILPIDSPMALPRVGRARVDHGTSELLAKIVLLDQESLPPGGEGYAQLRFDERVLVHPGDRFIVRSVTPVTTLGGGQIIDPAPRKHSAGDRWRDRLALLERGSAEEVAALLLNEAFPSGMSSRELESSPYLWRSTPAEAAEAVARLRSGGQAADEGGVLFAASSLERLRSDVLGVLRDQAEREPLDPDLGPTELRRELAGGREDDALQVALGGLVATGEVTRTEHGYRWSAAPDAGDSLGGSAERLLERLASTGGKSGVEAPTLAAAAEATGLDQREAKKIARSLVRQGLLTKVGADFYYPPERLETLTGRIVAAMESSGTLTLAETRDLLGTSRRYAQALLEHMDSEGLTLRVGEARRLRRRR